MREALRYVYSEVFDLKPTSGLSHAQSCLKNPAHLSHFFTERTVSADRVLPQSSSSSSSSSFSTSLDAGIALIANTFKDRERGRRRRGGRLERCLYRAKHEPLLGRLG